MFSKIIDVVIILLIWYLVFYGGKMKIYTEDDFPYTLQEALDGLVELLEQEEFSSMTREKKIEFLLKHHYVKFRSEGKYYTLAVVREWSIRTIIADIKRTIRRIINK